MKALSATLFVFAYALIAAAQNQPEKRILLTLQQGEMPYFTESNLMMNCGSTGFCLLVQHPDASFYVYENGIRKGPYKTAEEGMNVCYKEGILQHESKTVTVWEQEDMNDMILAADEGYVINFKGKSYGSYIVIHAISKSPDGLHFMAVARKQSGLVFVSDLFSEQAAPGEVKSLHWSPDSKSGFGLFMTGFDVSSLSNIDLSSMNEQQQMEYMMNIQKQIEETKEELYILFTDGRKTGPYVKGSESNMNPAYSLTAPGHWLMICNHQLYIDGTVVFNIPESEWISLDDVFLSPDGKKFAIRYYDRLYFSDGSTYAYPILLNRCSSNPNMIEWVSFENEQTLVYYSRQW